MRTSCYVIRRGQVLRLAIGTARLICPALFVFAQWSVGQSWECRWMTTAASAVMLFKVRQRSTLIYWTIVINGHIEGTINPLIERERSADGLGDHCRAECAQSLPSCHSHLHIVWMVSGDNYECASRMCHHWASGQIRDHLPPSGNLFSRLIVAWVPQSHIAKCRCHSPPLADHHTMLAICKIYNGQLVVDFQR